jgi:tRNA threonylcarbamoyladenosine biosynthesis protein TsaE
VRHLDLYRLRGPQDLASLGWDELVGGDAVTLVEWPERAMGQWPAGAIAITLSAPDGAPDVRDVMVDRP